MTGMASQHERVNQKRRTRAALVEAAQRLLDQGQAPTVADVADAALVSRATAYRYFPSQEHLLLDVVLARSIEEINRQVDAALGSSDVPARLEALVSAVQDEVLANEPGFRTLLQLSIAQQPSDSPTVASIRGERRLKWIEKALEPIAGELDERTGRLLVSALTLCVGAEGFVVLRDLCGLDPAEAEATLRWAALAMLAAAASGPKCDGTPDAE
jgi:AcrR family transcriptional regulator